MDLTTFEETSEGCATLYNATHYGTHMGLTFEETSEGCARNSESMRKTLRDDVTVQAAVEARTR